MGGSLVCRKSSQSAGALAPEGNLPNPCPFFPAAPVESATGSARQFVKANRHSLPRFIEGWSGSVGISTSR